MTDAASDRALLAARLLPLIDLTSLGETDDEAAILALARAARTAHGDVGAVCTWPRLAAVAVRALEGTGIPCAAVANFPAGDDSPEQVRAEIAGAVAQGVREIDVVLPYKALLAGDEAAVRELLSAAREACGEGIVLKVILESGQFASVEAIGRACTLAVEAGADFLKTSTGKTQPGATPEAARVMIEAVAEARARGLKVGFKASGGVRSLEQAGSYLEMFEAALGAGAATPANFRIGASSLLAEILQALGEPAAAL